MVDSSVNRKGIQSRLIRVFAVQATIVSLATALGVYAAYRIAEDVLVRQALAGEAEHYWRMAAKQSGFPLPNTNNMRGYLASADDLSQLPLPLQDLSAGFGPVSYEGGEPLVYVSERDDQKLYLLFKEEQVSNLALYFGVAPLTVVLMLIYLASWFTFRQSQRVISPVVKLATVVENADVRNSDTMAMELAPYHSIDADIGALATALEHFAERLESFVERERSFTRDASHELRTPLAVIKGSVDILLQQEQFTDSGFVVLQRMRATVQDMEGLIETLLFLAREEKPAPETEAIGDEAEFPAKKIKPGATAGNAVVVNDLLSEVVEQVKNALGEESADVIVDQKNRLEIQSSPEVLNILFTNLIKNALVHGSKPVEIIVDSGEVVIRDQGPGMDREEVDRMFQPFYRGTNHRRGHGLGLTIVKRLCDRFSWHLKVYSSPGAGTAITIRFTE